ncbi:Uncharacterised protein [Mycobacteroides abscessus subsp. abscessus]|nr:Uncharacterised protein [Mycobacteroides abscessus subsp. abscessus]
MAADTGLFINVFRVGCNLFSLFFSAAFLLSRKVLSIAQPFEGNEEHSSNA